ncbi:MAG TPA: hypothetical protein DEG28_01410 [Porphyromonadaceae bacterium]|nr:hypothetical protein [Porphyromonadaceae bacterium]
MKNCYSNKLKMKKLYLPLFSLILLPLASCDQEQPVLQKQEKTPLYFGSVLIQTEADITPRATGAQWEADDAIGIFAVNHQMPLEEGNIFDGSENVAFTTQGDGFFYPKGKNIYYPEGDASIDLIAYYPYDESISGYAYSIDLTKQTEFFYSNNLQDISKAKGGARTLEFRRPLTKIVLNITPKKEGSTLDGLTVTARGALVRGSFSLAGGTLKADETSTGDIELAVSGSSTQKQASGMFFPTGQPEALTVDFTLQGKTFTWRPKEILQGGKAYRYTIELDGLESTAALSTSYMEIPAYTSGGTAPHSASALHMVGDKDWLNPSYTVNNTSIRNYSILYDTENRVPYWVAYPMHSMYLGDAGRTEEWDYDPIISPKSVQPTLYNGWSSMTYNRGHLLASADRNATRVLNETTFYFTNMAPQDKDMNSGPWAVLENKVREWCKQSAYDTLYVVTGCILPESSQQYTYVNDNNQKGSVVPKYLYKALLRKQKNGGAYTSIAFRMENADTKSPYYSNIVSVETLEQETGFTFFPNLPADVAKEVKKNASQSPHWN